jgi:hypothetical protein
MLTLFDNCDASGGTGNNLHNVDGLQSVKSNFECYTYLCLYLINATSLAKPHTIQLLHTELLNKDFDIILLPKLGLLKCTWTRISLYQIMFFSVGIEVAEVVVFAHMFA